ncbi:MAG: hypothetical protein ACWGQW_06690 [bacterium]
MQRQTLAGETINVIPDEQFGPPIRIFSHKAPFAALQWLFVHGAIADSKGHATTFLMEKIVKEFDVKINSASSFSLTMKNQEDRGFIKRDKNGQAKRCYRISIDGCTFPQSFWDRCFFPLVEENKATQAAAEAQAESTPELELTSTPDLVPDEEQEPSAVQFDGLELLSAAVVDLGNALSNVGLAIAHLRSAPATQPEPMHDNDGHVDWNQLEQLGTVIAERDRLREELNRISHQVRSQPKGGQSHQRTSVTKPDNGTLDFRKMEIKDARLRILLRHAHKHGFKIEVLNNGHIRATPPDKTKDMVVTGGTPSDHRAYDNFYHQLIRAGMPKLPKK